MDHPLEKAQRVRFWTEDARVLGVVENVADGVIGIDQNGHIELFNRTAEQLFGYSASEVMGCNVKLLMPNDFAEHHDDYLENYLQTGERRIIGSGREVTGQRKDGSQFPMYLSVGDIELPEFRGFIGIVHDLSAQKTAEKEVESARQFLQAIIDSMPSALIGVDRQGQVTHWNRAAANDRRLSPEQAIGQSLFDIYPRLSLRPLDLEQAIDQQRVVSKERLALPIEGQVRFIDIVVYPLVQQATEGAVVRIDDITERVRLEEMMVQTEKMVSVGGLAAGMAHEINNPLGIIAGGCQNIVRRVSSGIDENQRVAEELGIELERVRGYLERRGVFRFLGSMREAIARATHIVSDILTYSRHDATSFVSIRVNNLIDTVLRLANHDFDLRNSYDFRHIDIQRETLGVSDELYCDELAIEQVLLNLLRNAAQAMARDSTMQEKPRITLRVADEETWLRIEVEDNGPGMEEEVVRRVFEPFFTTKPVGVGTGLGLSVAYFIITEQHHGKLAVQSAPNRGARFVIRLPRRGKTNDA